MLRDVVGAASCVDYFQGMFEAEGMQWPKVNWWGLGREGAGPSREGTETTWCGLLGKVMFIGTLRKK